MLDMSKDTHRLFRIPVSYDNDTVVSYLKSIFEKWLVLCDNLRKYKVKSVISCKIIIVKATQFIFVQDLGTIEII